MSWSAGSELADKLFSAVELVINNENDKVLLALIFAQEFEEYDCDTMYECEFVEKYLKWNEKTEGWTFK